MQRLFSTFPSGLPGYGLLLLRVICGAPLIFIGSVKLTGGAMDATRWIFALSCVSSAVLLAGLWTPFAALCHALLGSALAIYGDSFEWMYLIVALISLSLLMLGPGWWSIDARIYGRRRIDLGRPPRA